MEVMLDSIRQRDEKPKDSIPALPARPVSRGRLPSSRRFKNKGSSFPTAGEEVVPMGGERREDEIGKVKQPEEESRLAGLPELASCEKTGLDEFDGSEDSGLTSVSGARFEKKLDFVRKEDTVEDQSLLHPTNLEEFERRVMKVEAALIQKEEENLSLKQMLQQYESRWSEYEVRMKSMEEKWQNHMTSLQMSLAAAKKSLADDMLGIPGSLDPSANGHYFDFQKTSVEFRTPESTPAKQPHGFSSRLSRDTDGTKNPVRQEDDAKFQIEVRSGQLVPATNTGINTEEELQKLKTRFSIWKKDYKVKLQETKVSLQKLGNSESGKTHKKWWIMRSKK